MKKDGVIVGRVKSIDKKNRSGVISDLRGREYFFSLKDVQGESFPALNGKVNFKRDADYVTIDVAIGISAAA